MNDHVTHVTVRINQLQSDHKELEVRVNGLTAREKNLQAMEEQVAAFTRRPCTSTLRFGAYTEFYSLNNFLINRVII